MGRTDAGCHCAAGSLNGANSRCETDDFCGVASHVSSQPVAKIICQGAVTHQSGLITIVRECFRTYKLTCRRMYSAHPRPNPLSTQSSAGRFKPYSRWMMVAHTQVPPKRAIMPMYAMRARWLIVNRVQSRKWPKKKLAVICAKAETNDAKARERTEK